MGSTTEPTTGTEEKQQVKVEVEEGEEDEQVFDLERKTSPFHHGKGLYSADSNSSTITTTTNTSSSSSFSGDGIYGIPDFRNVTAIEDLEVPESPELETEIALHQEHNDGNNRNVYLDKEQGADAAGAEDAHDSQTVDHLNEEKEQSESESDSTSEDSEVSREIEEVVDDFPKELDVVDQPTGGVIEEELEIGDADDYDVEKVLENQETHDLFCPNCNACITKRVILKRRKRRIPYELEDPKRPRIDPLLRSEDNLPSADGGENTVPDSFLFKCLSCFSIFRSTEKIPGVSSKPLPSSESVVRLETQPSPQEEVAVNSSWFSSIFVFNKKRPALEQGGVMSTLPEANPPHDNLSGENAVGSTNNNPSEAQVLVQGDAATPIVQVDASSSIKDVSEISVSEVKKPSDSPLIKDATSEDTTEDEIDKTDSSSADGNQKSEKGHLSPIQTPHTMNISNKVTSGPDGVTVETVFHTEDTSHLYKETHTSDIRQSDFGLTVTSDGGAITGPPTHEIVSSLEEGTLTVPLLRPVVEGRKLEVLKSIVYGGLVESITSLGVISSAAGSGASTLNILVLGIANLFGGLILIIHNLQELREEEPMRTRGEDNETNAQEGRYKRVLGRRENFTLHASVAILSFIIMGLLPPVVYYFSFSKTHNKDYKVASVFGSSLLCIVLLAIAKAHVKTPRGSYLKSVLSYAMIAVSVSGISYEVGNFVDQLLEKYGWSDGSETPAGHMMLSLFGRKAGSFGYSSSY